jgi:hypothetical protein
MDGLWALIRTLWPRPEPTTTEPTPEQDLLDQTPMEPPSAALLAFLAQHFHSHNQTLVEDGFDPDELEEARKTWVENISHVPMFYIAARALLDLPQEAFGNA